MTMLAYSFPLFVPANRPDRFAKAAAAGTDTVIVDLEDAVSSDDKVNARRLAASALSYLSGADVWLRVNGAGTQWYEEDLQLARKSGVQGVVLPKAESRDELDVVREGLSPDQAVIALVETARGIRAAYEIAAACDRIIFGSVDFVLDLGCEPSRDACLMARSTLVIASRAARIAAPLDGITARIDDETLICSDAAYASGLGFGGKILIHPKQIAPSRTGFAPDPDVAAWARKVLAAGGGGEVRSVDGEMIDAPVIERARGILRLLGE
jgi:citrate lyase subunit beta / citryl-CoA lyase